MTRALRTVCALILGVTFTSVFCLSEARAQVPQERARNAVGVVEIKITTLGDPDGHTERATGAIVSPSGYVLTAGHILDDAGYNACAAAADAPPGVTCEIAFYLKGDPSRRVRATIASARSASTDYLLLRLPDADDVINQPEWPFVFVGEAPHAGASLFAAGYAGEIKLEAGSANQLSVVPGVFSGAPAQACAEGDGWGVSNQMSGRTGPGYSGGPVFDTRSRVVGIILGRTCTNDLQGVEATRVLTLASILNFCPTVSCRYSLPGYIAPFDPSHPEDWRARMDTATAPDTFIYGWKLSAIAALTVYALPCATFQANAALAQSIRDDYAAGGELATVYTGMQALCGAPLQNSDTLNQQIRALALAGYEPAENLYAQNLMIQIMPTIMASSNFHYNFSNNERTNIASAQHLFEDAGAHGWAAAQYSHFYFCRLRVFNCQPDANELERAADQGQFDARRELAMFLLEGNQNPLWTARFNFAMAGDTPRALDLLRMNAQPMPATSSAGVALYDNASASLLAYLYSGGRINGREIVPANLQSELVYEQGCYGGQFNPAFPLHAACFFRGAIARYNLGGEPEHQAAINAFQTLAQNPTPEGLASRNILAWIARGARHITCDMNETFDLAPSAHLTQPPTPGDCYQPLPH